MPNQRTPPWNNDRPLAAGARHTLLLRLGDRLKRARTQAGLTQAAAAEVVGTTAQTIRNWETARNEPPMSAIRKLAERYGVTEDSLLDNLSPPFAPSPSGFGFRYNRVFVKGDKLSEARRDTGLTQEKIAEMTGLSVSAIRRYERGVSSPSTVTLLALATIYDKEPGWFTTQGYFTDDDQQRFDASTKPKWIPNSPVDPVIAHYTLIKDHLTPEAKDRIINFLIFTYRHILSSRLVNVRTTNNPNPSSHQPDQSPRMPHKWLQADLPLQPLIPHPHHPETAAVPRRHSPAIQTDNAPFYTASPAKPELIMPTPTPEPLSYPLGLACIRIHLFTHTASVPHPETSSSPPPRAVHPSYVPSITNPSGHPASPSETYTKAAHLMSGTFTP